MRDPADPLITAEEFLEIDFGSDRRFELDEGVIVGMTGGTVRHAMIQSNLLIWIGPRLRRTGCRTYGSDLGVRIGDYSLRYPDVSIYCGGSITAERDGLKVIGDPRVVLEVLSPTTAKKDRTVKLAEYKSLAGVDTVALIDPDKETCQISQRLSDVTWRDDIVGRRQDVELPSLMLTIPHAEIFARD